MFLKSLSTLGQVEILAKLGVFDAELLGTYQFRANPLLCSRIGLYKAAICRQIAI